MDNEIKYKYKYEKGGQHSGECGVLYIDDKVVFFKPDNAAHRWCKLDVVELVEIVNG